MTASQAMTFPAVQLFMDRVAASGVQETLTDEMALLAVEICRKMDGIALAIEWAAGRVRSHGLRGTAELISHRGVVDTRPRPLSQVENGHRVRGENLLHVGDRGRRILAALDAVINQVEPAIYLFKDMHPFLVNERCNLSVIRRLRDVAHQVADAIYDREVVSELYSTSGEYDLLAKVYVPEDQDVGHYLSERLFDIPDISRTLTTMTFRAF